MSKDTLRKFERALYREPVAWYCGIEPRDDVRYELRGTSSVNGLLLTVTVYDLSIEEVRDEQVHISIALSDADGDFMFAGEFALAAYENALAFIHEIVNERVVIEVHRREGKTSVMPSASASYARFYQA
ncbi:MAG: hypothetical protein ACXWNJ_01315 [Vulcanimicrobiaceae bacterium]